jgi:hypothetical protein
VLLRFADATLAVNSPYAAHAARQLARLGYLDAAAAVLARVQEQWPILDTNDRSASQSASATTLALLGRPDEARSAALDAFDNGRTAGSWYQPAVYGNLAEALHDIGDTEALTSLYDTLSNTSGWWER